MFPITIPTLVTEEVYQRFAWSIFLRGKSFLLNIIILIGILSLYLTFLPDNLKRFSFFTVLFISLVTFSAMYFGMDFQIKKAYQKRLDTLSNLIHDFIKQYQHNDEHHLLLRMKAIDGHQLSEPYRS